MKALPFFILVSFLVGVNSLSAQDYRPYLAIGTNIVDDRLTENGRSQVGTRMGWSVGPGVTGRIGKRLDLGLELLYSQNADYAELEEIPTNTLDKIRLHYLEVPVSLLYRVGLKTKEKRAFDRSHIGGGLTFARLLDHRVIDIQDQDLSEQLSFRPENALAAHVTATNYFSDVFGLNGRVSLSSFGAWTLTVRLIYRFD